jgi:hypothetical protein
MCLTSEDTRCHDRDEVAENQGRLFLSQFLKQSSTLNWKLESLSIGRNNWRTFYVDNGILNNSNLDLMEAWPIEVSQWLGSLKSLHIPVAPKPSPLTGNAPALGLSSYTELLACTAASLQNLSLWTDWYIREPLGEVSGRRSPSPFAELLSSFRFDKLVSFELRGWRFSLELEGLTVKREISGSQHMIIYAQTTSPN